MSADAIADVVSAHADSPGWDVAPHDLRRTFAKLARSGQAPLEQIQLALGHQSIQTTSAIWAPNSIWPPPNATGLGSVCKPPVRKAPHLAGLPGVLCRPG